MDPLSIAVSAITIVQVATQVVSAAVSYGKSVAGLPEEVRALVQEISLISDALNSLHNVMNDVAEAEKTGLKLHASFTSASLKPHMEECNAQLLLLQSFLQKGRGRRARLKSFGRSLGWPMQVQDTRDWIMRMESFKGNFSLALQTASFELKRMIQGDVQEIKLAQQADREEKEREKQTLFYNEVLKWLSMADPRENHVAARKLQGKGTGGWFIESNVFREWKSTEGSLLWLYGTAGTGKTILSSLIIDNLDSEKSLSTTMSQQGVTNLYFYCDFKDVGKTSAVGIYGSLVAQLFEHHWSGHLPPGFDIDNYFKTGQTTPPQEASLRQLLLEAFAATSGQIRIVMDALDECHPKVRSELMNTLFEVQKSTGTVNLLLTSREEVDISFNYDEHKVTSKSKHKIKSSDTAPDLERFVNEFIENSRLRVLTDPIKEVVRQAVIGGADGMFRWAKCTLDYVSRLHTNKQIKDALLDLPPGLYPTYDRILSLVKNEEDKVFTKQALHWLACATRPLTLEEVVEALALELGDREIDPDKRLNDPQSILEFCGSLVTINDDARKTVVLAHKTVKDFLTSTELKNGIHSEFYIDPSGGNVYIAMLCVTYLNLDCFSSGPCQTEEEYRSRIAKNALLKYAAKSWPEHAREHTSPDEDFGFLAVVGGFFLNTAQKGNFLSWAQLYCGDKSLKEYLNLDGECDSRLIYACRLGLTSITRYLLANGLDPNTKSSQTELAPQPWGRLEPCGNPLNAAVQLGSIELIKLLLDSGADINACAGCYELPVIYAINREYQHGKKNYDVLEYLLQRGAAINQKSPKGNFALYEASWGTNSAEATRLCIAAGADLGMRSTSGSTMLELTGAFGQREPFVLLWKAGAGLIPNPTYPWTFTPGVDGISLLVASLSNFHDIGKLILDKDGEKILNDRSFDPLVYYTFRRCALKGYYKFLEQMLVYSGTDCIGFLPALHEAATEGNDMTVGVLLAALEGKPVPGFPLVLAAAKGNIKVINRLLEAGCDPTTLDPYGWSAWEAASLCKQAEVLEMFSATGKTAPTLPPPEPSSWQIDTTMLEHHELLEPKLVIDDGMVHLLPENKSRYCLFFNRPIPPRQGFYYFEITILEAASKFEMRVGLISALAPYDLDHSTLYSHARLCDRALGYTNEGQIAAVSSYRGPNCPTYAVGDVIGCAVDVDKEVAFFTHNGKLVEVAVEGTKGLLFGAVNLSPGTKIRANFGNGGENSGFRFDVSELGDNLERLDMPKVEFCSDAPPEDPYEQMMTKPNLEFVG